MERIDCNLIMRNMPDCQAYGDITAIGNERKSNSRVIRIEKADVDYNNVYRNMPGWYHKEEAKELADKVMKAEDAKKPVIAPVSAVEKSASVSLKSAQKALAEKNKKREISDAEEEEENESFYDKAGSKIRNDLRRAGLYNSNGEKVALV